MTNSNNGMDVQAIAAAVKKFDEDFKTLLVAEQDKVKQSISDRDAQAYLFAAGLLDLALLLKPETPSVPLIEFLNARGQKTVKAGDNPYVPFVKAICAIKDGDKWKTNPKEASFGKYANIVRQLIEDKKAGRVSGSVVEYIKAYEWNGRKKLGALEARDRFERPNQTQVDRADKHRERGRKAQPIEILDTQIDADDGEVLVLWGVIKNGKLEVMERMVDDSASAESRFYQLGKTLAPKS